MPPLPVPCRSLAGVRADAHKDTTAEVPAEEASVADGLGSRAWILRSQ